LCDQIKENEIRGASDEYAREEKYSGGGET
jgi:hypothetical protein